MFAQNSVKLHYDEGWLLYVQKYFEENTKINYLSYTLSL